MRILDIIRRPKRCPNCGGEVCDILYGMPTATWEEDHLANTGHKALLGGCCIMDNAPDYECEDCHLQIRSLSFPSNAKTLAREALLKDDSDIFTDVNYVGLYKKKMVYEPVSRPGYCWDGLILIFVDQTGKARLRYGLQLVEILAKIQVEKEKFEKRSEKFYWYAAMREIKGEESYYKTVRKIGWYHGKRAYEPILKDEYLKEPPCIGLPLVILVDSKGRASYIRDCLSFSIYKEIRKKSKNKNH